MNEPLFDALAVLGGVIAATADQRRAVLLAAIAVALTLSPVAAFFEGGSAVLLLYSAVAAGGILGGITRILAHRIGGSRKAIDPIVPVYTPKTELFGSRSRRLTAAALAIPVASWISYNIPAGAGTDLYAVMFPVAFIAICGGIRLLLARTVEDLAVGVAVTGIAAGVGWMVHGGASSLSAAVAPLLLAVAAIVIADWLSARDTSVRRAVSA